MVMVTFIKRNKRSGTLVKNSKITRYFYRIHIQGQWVSNFGSNTAIGLSQCSFQ